MIYEDAKQPTTLTEREIQVLRQVATGAGNKEIARELAISPNTVRNHLYAAFAKLGVQSRTAAALYAVRAGWA